MNAVYVNLTDTTNATAPAPVSDTLLVNMCSGVTRMSSARAELDLAPHLFCP